MTARKASQPSPNMLGTASCRLSCTCVNITCRSSPASCRLCGRYCAEEDGDGDGCCDEEEEEELGSEEDEDEEEEENSPPRSKRRACQPPKSARGLGGGEGRGKGREGRALARATETRATGPRHAGPWLLRSVLPAYHTC